MRKTSHEAAIPSQTRMPKRGRDLHKEKGRDVTVRNSAQHLRRLWQIRTHAAFAYLRVQKYKNTCAHVNADTITARCKRQLDESEAALLSRKRSIHVRVACRTTQTAHLRFGGHGCAACAGCAATSGGRSSRSRPGNLRALASACGSCLPRGSGLEALREASDDVLGEGLAG